MASLTLRPGEAGSRSTQPSLRRTLTAARALGAGELSTLQLGVSPLWLALPSVDDLIDSVALAYYSLVGLALWKKALLVGLVSATAALYFLLRDKVERFALAVRYAYDDLKLKDPEMAPLWKGLRWDWGDAVENVWKPAMRRREEQRKQREEALKRREEAWGVRLQAEQELQRRIAEGTWTGADAVSGQSHSGTPGAAGA